MPRSTKILIFLGVILAVFLGLIWFFVFREPKLPAAAPSVSVPINTETSNLTDTNGTAPSAPQPAVQVDIDASGRAQVAVVQIASAFTERFGSFSNQGVQYRNIRDLQIFMTDSMQEWSERYIAEFEAKPSDNFIYYGITTKVLSNDILRFDDASGDAEILLKTQRREAIGNTINATIYYQEMRIVMKKENGVWKVDGAYWEKKI